MKQDISLTKLPFQVMSWCCKSSIRICISNFCGTLIQMPNGDKVPSWSSQHQSFRFKTLFRGFFKSDETFISLLNVASILLTRIRKNSFGNHKELINTTILQWCKWVVLLVHGFLKHRKILRRQDYIFWNLKWPRCCCSRSCRTACRQVVCQPSKMARKHAIAQISDAYNLSLPGSW